MFTCSIVACYVNITGTMLNRPGISYLSHDWFRFNGFCPQYLVTLPILLRFAQICVTYHCNISRKKYNRLILNIFGIPFFGGNLKLKTPC